MFHSVYEQHFNSSVVRSALWGAIQHEGKEGSDFQAGIVVRLAHGNYFYPADFSVYSRMCSSESAGKFYNAEIRGSEGSRLLGSDEIKLADGVLADVLRQIAGETNVSTVKDMPAQQSVMREVTLSVNDEQFVELMDALRSANLLSYVESVDIVRS